MSRLFLDDIQPELLKAAQGVSAQTINELFKLDPQRVKQYSRTVGAIHVDYSKQLLDQACWDALFDFSQQAQLSQGIQQLLSGEVVNATENRPAHHAALRSDQHPEVREVLARMEQLVDEVHQHQRLGVTGLPLTQIVNIGIGGSDLGPRLVVEALSADRQKDIQSFFLSNIDGSAIDRLFDQLDPAQTLVCVTSKSFSTRETLTNACSLRNWMADKLGVTASRLDQHFIAITAKPEKAFEFGVATASIYPMWDWVGGRYSLWSAVGLPIALALGMENFRALLSGAKLMDEHFATEPMAQNLPVILGLLGVWQRVVQSFTATAVVPYDERLCRLPDFLQQLDMESNGKSVRIDGQPVAEATGPVIWGGAGTNGQHAFFQWLHQGKDVVPLEFIAAIKPHHEFKEHHRQLLANMIGQSWALMAGRSLAETQQQLRKERFSEAQIEALSAHRAFPGNRPSTVILLDQLTPASLGQLIALYEHKVFVQGWLWGINSFDQWGVELGKTLANQVEDWMLHGVPEAATDESTCALIKRISVNSS